MIHIICDSTAGLAQEFVDAHENIHVVPLYISLGGDYIDERELTQADVFDYVRRTDQQPLTSQPSVGQLMELDAKIPEEDGIIALTITSCVSGTTQTMQMVAKQSRRKHFVALDSMSTESGMRFMIESALQMIEEGRNFDEIVAHLEKQILRIRTMFVPGTLEYLRRGGRIGKAANLIGTLLQIRPIIYIDESNQLNILDKVRTNKKAHRKMMEAALAKPVRRIAIPDLDCAAEADALCETIKEQLPGVLVERTKGTPALACHLGPGLVAIMVEWQEEA